MTLVGIVIIGDSSLIGTSLGLDPYLPFATFLLQFVDSEPGSHCAASPPSELSRGSRVMEDELGWKTALGAWDRSPLRADFENTKAAESSSPLLRVLSITALEPKEPLAIPRLEPPGTALIRLGGDGAGTLRAATAILTSTKLSSIRVRCSFRSSGKRRAACFALSSV